MSIVDLNRKLSWRFKLGIIALLPILTALYLWIAFSQSLSQQNTIMQQRLLESGKRQSAAATNLVSILEMQYLIQALIAADDKSDIRKFAISSLKASSILGVLKKTFRNNARQFRGQRAQSKTCRVKTLPIKNHWTCQKK